MFALGELAARDAGDLFDGKPHLAPATAKLTYRGGALAAQRGGVHGLLGPKVERRDREADSGRHQSVLRRHPRQRTARSARRIFGAGQVHRPRQVRRQQDHQRRRADRQRDRQRGASRRSPSGSRRRPFRSRPRTRSISSISIPGIVSIMGGSKSCQNYCGYHSNAGATYYAVMPYPTCSGCLGGMTALDAITGTSSHELCEAITDPVPGTGLVRRRQRRDRRHLRLEFPQGRGAHGPARMVERKGQVRVRAGANACTRTGRSR